MGSERRLRGVVVQCLKRAGLHAFAVENACLPGTPDVAYADGWIELKQIDERPKLSRTAIKVDHFTKRQRIFLEDHWEAGGNAFLLIQVERTYFLFDGDDAAKHVGDLSWAEMHRYSRAYWDSQQEMRKELPEWVHRDRTHKPR